MKTIPCLLIGCKPGPWIYCQLPKGRGFRYRECFRCRRVVASSHETPATEEHYVDPELQPNWVRIDESDGECD